jgi:protein-S-isoprenylcysteine O-methyltransferase Ste14
VWFTRSECILAAEVRRVKLLAGIRTAVYMTGFVAVWAWLALAVRRFDRTLGLTLPAWAGVCGIAAIAVGGALGLTCGFLFAARGYGTPAPFDPPREFVVAGPYRYVRNPMYIGGLVTLAGFGLAQRSPAILLLAAGSALLVHLFVVLLEEPQLEWRFGDGYRTYKRSVNRWLPRPVRAAGR